SLRASRSPRAGWSGRARRPYRSARRASPVTVLELSPGRVPRRRRASTGIAEVGWTDLRPLGDAVVADAAAELVRVARSERRQRGAGRPQPGRNGRGLVGLAA